MKQLLAQLVAGRPLTTDQTVEAFELIMTGSASPPQTAALLAMVQQRGPTVEEITGAATVMRRKVSPVAVPDGLTAVDTCGTGGDHAQTFNISTAAALVAAAAARPHDVVIAKHGNRSVTSKSGSSQVLEALGVKLKVTGDTLTRCLDEAGICFCFAPMHHPAMKHAGPIRAELGFRTLFNILGPLTNPAGARRQVMGVFAPDLTEPIATVLLNLGAEHAMVVHGTWTDASGGTCGLDEVTTTGPTRISTAKGGAVQTTEFDPAALSLAPVQMSDLQVDGVEASADMIRAVLAGDKGPARDIVCLNAAAALVVADLAADLPTGLATAQATIDNGAAAAALEKLVAITAADPTED